MSELEPIRRSVTVRRAGRRGRAGRGPGARGREVEIRFTPQGDGTLLELEHRGWERLGPAFAELRQDYARGWGTTLELFAAAADREVA